MTSSPREFFDRADQVFIAARAAAPEVDPKHLSLGGLTVRIETATAKIDSRLTNAFEHLKLTGEETPQLTICAWDSSTTGVQMIAPPWSEADYGARGLIRGFNEDGFRTSFEHGSGAFSMIDYAQRRALFWTRDAGLLPQHEMAAPFRTILSWLAEEHDRVLVHGGAVANECGGVLFAGRGGAGKSTTALLCWHAGWHYLGDDYCLVQPGPATRVFSIYNSAKLTRSAVEKLGRPIASAQIGIGAEKEMLFVSERVARSATCRVIFLPRVAGERQTTIENASAAEALRALAPSSIFQLSGAGAVSFRRLSQFVREVPARRLNLGTDLAQIPPAIAECVANL